jgi:hypothetical protein
MGSWYKIIDQILKDYGHKINNKENYKQTRTLTIWLFFLSVWQTKSLPRPKKQFSLLFFQLNSIILSP